MTMSNNNNVGQLGDTTLTKIFVGGLAWETPKEALKDHFDIYGEILEAVIISDKFTGRSKGYGFVTFKEVEAAKKACKDPTPVIYGRRANCNLASLGARKPMSALAITPPQQQGLGLGDSIIGQRSVSPVPTTNMQWYYHTGSQSSPYHHQTHHPTIPFYGYNPAYIAADISYNHAQKVGYTGGWYLNARYSQVYPAQSVMRVNSSPIPDYHPTYYHQSHIMGLRTHYYTPTTVAPAMGPVPTLISKPTSMGPNTVC